MSDDAAVGADRGAHASESLSQNWRRLYPEAYECPEPSEPPDPGAHASEVLARDLNNQIVPIDLAGAKRFLPKSYSIYQPRVDLFYTRDDRWFCAYCTAFERDFVPFPGSRYRVAFWEIKVKEVPDRCSRLNIEFSPALSEAHKSSMARWVVSQADQSAGTTNPPTAASTPRLGPQAPPDTEAASPTPPVGNQPSKARGAAADPESAAQHPRNLVMPASQADDSPAGRERRVADYLEKNQNATSKAVHEATGIPETTIRNMPVWKEHQAKKKTRQKGGSVQGVPLTEEMLASLTSRDRHPSEIVEENDFRERFPEKKERYEREYLEQATPKERAEYYQMEPDEQGNTLWIWLNE